eukprot:738625_1
MGLEQGRPSSQLLCTLYYDHLSVEVNLDERHILTTFVDDIGLLSQINYPYTFSIERWTQDKINVITRRLHQTEQTLKSDKTNGIIFINETIRRNWMRNIKCDIELRIGDDVIK